MSFVWQNLPLPGDKTNIKPAFGPIANQIVATDYNAVKNGLLDIRNAFLQSQYFYAKDYGVDFTGDATKTASNLAGLNAASAAAKLVGGTVFLHPGIIVLDNSATWVVDGHHVVGCGGYADWGGPDANWQIVGSPATGIKHAVQDASSTVPIVYLNMAHPQTDPEGEARGYVFKGVGLWGSMSKAQWLAMPEPTPGTPSQYLSFTGEHGLVVDNNRAFIEDVSISGVTGHGVVIRDMVGGTLKSVVVTGCLGDGCYVDDNNVIYVPNNSSGLLRAISDSTVIGCLFTGCGRDGIRMYSGPADFTFINCDSEFVQCYGLRFIGSSFRAPHENTFIGQWVERCAADVVFGNGADVNAPSVSLIGSGLVGGAYCNDVEISHGNDPSVDGWANGDTRPGGFCNTVRNLNANSTNNATGTFPTERRAPMSRVYGMALPRLVFNSTGATNLDLLPLAGGLAEITLIGSVTYTFNTPRDGQVFIFAFTNAGAAHNYTVTWDGRMDWLGSAPVIRTGSGVRSIVAFYYDLDANLFHELYRTPSSI